MLLKLELDSNYSLQAIVLMLLQLLLGNQTQHLQLWEVWMPTSKFARQKKTAFTTLISSNAYEETSAGDRM